jgi:hypothetical protein
MNSGYGISVLNQRENVTNYNFTQINAIMPKVRVVSDIDLSFLTIEVGFGLKSFCFKIY